MLTAKIAGHVNFVVSLMSFFFLFKLYLDFKLLFLPKMCKILSVRRMAHPQQTFTKYYMWQIFNRITECECVWRIPWWIIGVSEFSVKMSSPNFSLDMLISFMLINKKRVWNVKKGNWFLQKLIFETFWPGLFSNLPPIRKNNLCKALFQFSKINSAKLPGN